MLSQTIWWTGSILGIILGLIKLYEFVSNKPKLYLSIRNLSAIRSNSNKLTLDYDFDVINLGRKVVVTLYFRFFEVKRLSTAIYSTHNYCVVNKDDIINVKGNRTIDIPKNSEGKKEFPIDMIVFLKGPKKIYLRKHIRLLGGVAYTSIVGKYDIKPNFF